MLHNMFFPIAQHFCDICDIIVCSCDAKSFGCISCCATLLQLFEAARHVTHTASNFLHDLPKRDTCFPLEIHDLPYLFDKMRGVHRPGWKLMDVAVLSSQKLTALKDVIKCEADANMKSQRQDRPNGYFYIEVSYT